MKRIARKEELCKHNKLATLLCGFFYVINGYLECRMLVVEDWRSHLFISLETGLSLLHRRTRSDLRCSNFERTWVMLRHRVRTGALVVFSSAPVMRADASLTLLILQLQCSREIWMWSQLQARARCDTSREISSAGATCLGPFVQTKQPSGDCRHSDSGIR